jgi:cytochrome c553
LLHDFSDCLVVWPGSKPQADAPVILTLIRGFCYSPAVFLRLSDLSGEGYPFPSGCRSGRFFQPVLNSKLESGFIMNKWLVTASISLALAAGGAQAAGNAEAGQTKSAACVACHGPEGNSPANPLWPKLAGQHAKFLEKQLQDFKSGARNDPTMIGMVAPLSPQDMADIAAYFSGKQRKGGTAAPDQVAMGEKLYRAGNPATGVSACMACHGPAGNGNPQANFPALAGQHAAYTEKALKDFRSGARANDASKMMQGVAARMTDAEVAAVAQYIQGLSN